MKVSVSFLSSKDKPRDLRLLDQTDVDYIHVDVMDGKFVPNKTMPFSEMRQISKYTNKRLDVHLMVEDPREYIKEYAELNTEYITFHVEIDEDIEECLNMIKDYSIKAGLAIKPNTPISYLIPYLPLVDMILVMSVEPGKGGQSFIENSGERINEIRDLLNEYGINAVINVDGGINDQTVKECSACDIVTSGNYITSSDDFKQKVLSLR